MHLGISCFSDIMILYAFAVFSKTSRLHLMLYYMEINFSYL